MTLTPHPFFRVPILIMDRLSPFIVIVSVVGLILEFTPLKHVKVFYFFDVKTFNIAVDLVFLLDFLVRFIAFPKRAYFFKGYGWVDLLAAVPGILFLLEQIPGFLGFFKILRIGRFFKIVRLLRFLKMFQYLKGMKGDSPYVQSRIMKIGLAVVFCGIVTIFLVEYFFERHYVKSIQDKVPAYHQLTGSFSQALQLLDPGAVVAWREGGEFYKDMGTLMMEKTYRRIGHLEDHLLVVFDERHSAIFMDPGYVNDRNAMVLTILLGMIFLLLFTMFYMGSVFAKDMSVVTLISDSIDADDFMLLEDEGQHPKNPDGSVLRKVDDDEIQTLLRRMGRLVREKKLRSFDPLASVNGEALPSLEVDPEDSESGSSLDARPVPVLDAPLPDMEETFSDAEAIAQESAGTASLRKEIAKLRKDLAGLTETLSAQSRETAIQAVRVSAKSIVEYLRKNKLSK